MTIDPMIRSVLSDLVPTDPIDAICWWTKLRQTIENPVMLDRFRAATGNYYDIPAYPSLVPVEFTEEQRATNGFIRCFAKWFNRMVWDRLVPGVPEGRWEC